MERDYLNLEEKELELIIQDGLKSEFWKWLSVMLKQAQENTKDKIMRLRLESWDDTIQILKFQSVYKTREELLNLPGSVITSIEKERDVQKERIKTQPSLTAV